MSLFSSVTAATLSKAQMDEIKGFDAALRNALALMAAGGERDAVKKDHYAHAAPACTRFDRAADRLFFPSLWRRFTVDSQGDDAVFKAKYTFLDDLMKAARAELKAALPAIPCTAIHRPAFRLSDLAVHPGQSRPRLPGRADRNQRARRVDPLKE